MRSVGAGMQRCLKQYGGIPKLAALSSIAANYQLQLYGALAHNRSGGTIDVGLLRLLNALSTSWKIYKLATATYTDVSAAIKAGTATAFFTSNNDAIYIGSKVPFGIAGLGISTSEAGSPVYTYKYYNGTSFATLTMVETITSYLISDDLLVFIPPYNWAKGGNASLDSNMYFLEIKATTAPSTLPQLNNAWVAEWLTFREGVVDNGSLELDANIEPLMFESGEGLVPYFGTANAANLIEASYKNMG